MMTPESPRESTPAASLSPDAIEGCLLAHRSILALILAEMRRTGGGENLVELLDSLSVVQDHQEDPGADLSGPEVIEGYLAQEIAAVVRASSRQALP